MNRIQRPNRLAWKGLPRTLDDLWADAQQMPVGRRRHEVPSAVRGLPFLQLTERDGTKEYAVALDQGQVGRDDDFSGREYFPDGGP